MVQMQQMLNDVAVLHSMLKVREDEKSKTLDFFMKIREFPIEVCNTDLPKNLADL